MRCALIYGNIHVIRLYFISSFFWTFMLNLKLILRKWAFVYKCSRYTSRSIIAKYTTITICCSHKSQRSIIKLVPIWIPFEFLKFLRTFSRFQNWLSLTEFFTSCSNTILIFICNEWMLIIGLSIFHLTYAFSHINITCWRFIGTIFNSFCWRGNCMIKSKQVTLLHSILKEITSLIPEYATIYWTVWMFWLIRCSRLGGHDCTQSACSFILRPLYNWTNGIFLNFLLFFCNSMSCFNSQISY